MKIRKKNRRKTKLISGLPIIELRHDVIVFVRLVSQWLRRSYTTFRHPSVKAMVILFGRPHISRTSDWFL